MTELIETLGPWTPFIVFIAAYFETAAFLGIVVPGETIMLAGGAAAGASGTPIGVIIVAAVLGAALGDATGYLLGGDTAPHCSSEDIFGVSPSRWIAPARSSIGTAGGR